MQHHLVSNHSYISVAQQYRSLSAFPRIPSSCYPLPPLATRKLANSLITSCVLFGRLHRKKQIKWRDQVAVTSSPCTVEYHKVAKGTGLIIELYRCDGANSLWGHIDRCMVAIFFLYWSTTAVSICSYIDVCKWNKLATQCQTVVSVHRCLQSKFLVYLVS